MGVTMRFRNGAWWIFTRHKNKRQAKRVGPDKEVALKLKLEMEERFAREALDLPPIKAAPLLLRTFAANWLEAAATTHKKSTVRFYTDNIENHIVPILGDYDISKVTRAEVRKLLSALKLKGLQPKTVTGVIRTLSTLLSEAVEDGKLPANPALRPGRLQRRMRDPNAPKREEIDPFTRAEVDLLTETAARHYPEWHPFLLCAVRTGMRMGELRALHWGSIDWRERFLRVENNFVEGQFTTPKNGHDRNVDMSMQLRATLRLWRRKQRIAWLAKGKPLPELVFPEPASGKPLDDSKIRKAMIAIAKKADVRVRKKPIHVLRHTFASLLIQQGESIVYVKDQMGHSSIDVTVKAYVHLIPGGNRSAVDRLDSVPDVAKVGRRSA